MKRFNQMCLLGLIVGGEFRRGVCVEALNRANCFCGHLRCFSVWVIVWEWPLSGLGVYCLTNV